MVFAASQGVFPKRKCRGKTDQRGRHPSGYQTLLEGTDVLEQFNEFLLTALCTGHQSDLILCSLAGEARGRGQGRSGYD